MLSFLGVVQQHMLIVFFVYGLAFFILGVLILVMADPSSKLKIGQYFWLLGIFGVLHGINEWMDMVLLYVQSTWSAGAIGNLVTVRNLTAVISFIFLLQFGVWALIIDKARYRWLGYVVLLLSILMTIIGLSLLHTMSGIQGFEKIGEVVIRYFIGFPGALLTALAFWRGKKQPEIVRLNSHSINVSFSVMALIFLVYAVLTGVIVPQTNIFPSSIINYNAFLSIVGLPVQVFRALCAVGAAVIAYWVLEVFTLKEYEE